jgi:hypothetical protein
MPWETLHDTTQRGPIRRSEPASRRANKWVHARRKGQQGSLVACPKFCANLHVSVARFLIDITRSRSRGMEKWEAFFAFHFSMPRLSFCQPRSRRRRSVVDECGPMVLWWTRQRSARTRWKCLLRCLDSGMHITLLAELLSSPHSQQ